MLFLEYHKYQFYKQKPQLAMMKFLVIVYFCNTHWMIMEHTKYNPQISGKIKRLFVTETSSPPKIKITLLKLFY